MNPRCTTKAGVCLPVPLKPTTVRIIDVVSSVTHPTLTVITSGDDGTHKQNSKHYTGDALDFRSKHWGGDYDRFLAPIRAALGPDYDVVLESKGLDQEHLHIEYDPKGVA